MSQDEGMSEFPVETLDKAVGLRLIWTGGIKSLCHLERHTEFNASKGDDALLKFSLSNRQGRGTLCFLSQVACTTRFLTQKKVGFPCSGLNLGSCFISQYEGMSESPVDFLEKAVGLRLIRTVGIISL